MKPLQAKDDEIRDLKTENRDQKKEIEDIRAERDLYLKPGIHEQLTLRKMYQISQVVQGSLMEAISSNWKRES